MKFGMPKISVIVPIYNVEKYIGECIESILAQTLSDIELILIDDGSPDKSGAICDEYAKRDSRINVFHKKNGGVSSARNLGIEKAQGEWLCFVDGDDRINPTYLEDFCADDSFDFCVQGYVEVLPTGEVINRHKIEFVDTNNANILAELENKIIINSPCFKLYRRNIINSYDIRFDENLSLGEDHIFSLTYYLFVNSIKVSTSMGYVVNRGINSSLTQRLVPLNEMIYYYEIFRKLQKELINKLGDINCSLRKAFNERNYILIMRTLEDIYKRGVKINEIKTFKLNFFNDMNVAIVGLPIRHKCALYLLNYLPVNLCGIMFSSFGKIVLRLIR